MAEPAGFLARWSRLKRLARAEPSRRPAITEPEASPTIPAVPSGETAPASPPPAAEPAPKLPPIETLGKDSNYTAFMRPDIPDALRNQALRKLWGSDPVYANLDGLVEYGEDYGEAFRLGGAVETAYRVLKGMPDPKDRGGLPESGSEEAASSVPDAAAETTAQLAAADGGPVADPSPHAGGRVSGD